jgi:hypothetical protein
MESDWIDENFSYFRKFKIKIGISQKPCCLTDLGFSYAQKIRTKARCACIFSISFGAWVLLSSA